MAKKIAKSIISKNILLLAILTIVLSSCSTILKSKTYKVKVTSNLKNAKVKTNDSVYKLPTNIEVKRSKEDLNLILISDTLKLDYKVLASPHQTFLYWNLIGFAPLNYVVDFTNDKRFHYGEHLYLNSKDTLRTLTPSLRKSWNNFFDQKYPRSKNDINLFISIPYVNSFNFKPHNYGTRINTGFWGISAGLEYFYASNKYIGIKFTGATDIFVPVPASPGGNIKEHLSTTFIEVTDNFKFGRLNIGYGINYSSNNWRYKDEIDSENEIEITRKNKSFGITTNTYFQIGKSFFVGVIYRPTFYIVKPTTDFKYEHLISFDLAWKIPLRKK